MPSRVSTPARNASRNAPFPLLRHKHKPRLGKNCPDPSVTDPCSPAANAAPRSRIAPGQHKQWIRAAHLRKARNRLRTFGRQPHQCLPTACRSVKATALHRRMLHKGRTHLCSRIQQQAKHPSRQATCCTATRTAVADQLTVPGVRRVSLHHHRTPGRQCRRGIPARHRKRKRKIARAKHRHRSYRPQHRPHIRSRQRLPVGQRLIDARINPRAFLQPRRQTTAADQSF